MTEGEGDGVRDKERDGAGTLRLEGERGRAAGEAAPGAGCRVWGGRCRDMAAALPCRSLPCRAQDAGRRGQAAVGCQPAPRRRRAADGRRARFLHGRLHGSGDAPGLAVCLRALCRDP